MPKCFYDRFLLVGSILFIVLAALFLSHDHVHAQTIAPAQFGYHGKAVLPDATATPGDTGTMTVKQLCAATFHTGTVRNVPESMKQKACKAYGIARANCTGRKYEIDHLISLELGGTNDQKNLWPQPYFPKPGAKQKDVVENWLHAQVCHGAMTLEDAQHSIATDWYAVFLAVPAARGGGGK
jgi:hypothetical protein